MAVKKGTAKKKSPAKKKAVAKKKVVAKKVAVKKVATKKSTVKKTPAKPKAAAKKKPVAKKSAAKKVAAKKTVVKKAASKKAVAKKAVSKKAVAKKVVSKKAAPKKAVAKKQTVTKKPAAAEARKLTAIRERYSKTDIVNELALNAGLNRKQVCTVLDELAILVSRHIKKRSVGEFVLAGLVKVTTVKRAAKKARKGINPFTGKMTSFKAKPANVAVKVHALKGLKDMAQ
tara:strand:+ start:3150 stop:3839 length:690 start_codon:yes stop_codon:yes gene_type:complete